MNTIYLNSINIRTINLDGEVIQLDLFDQNGLIKSELLPATADRFLSLWDCSIGKPTSEPSVVPYTYKTGDYYRVSVTASINYMPTGTQYTGLASSVVCEDTVTVGDTFYFDGQIWQLQKGGYIDSVRDVLTFGGESIVESGIAKLPQYSTEQHLDEKLDDEVERADNKYGTKEELNTKINENDAIEIITDRLVTEDDVDDLFK